MKDSSRFKNNGTELMSYQDTHVLSYKLSFDGVPYKLKHNSNLLFALCLESNINITFEPEFQSPNPTSMRMFPRF